MTEPFFKLCSKHFKFLIDEFGCRLMGKKSDNFKDELIYRNATTAVKVGTGGDLAADRKLVLSIDRPTGAPFKKDRQWICPTVTQWVEIELDVEERR